MQQLDYNIIIRQQYRKPNFRRKHVLKLKIEVVLLL